MHLKTKTQRKNKRANHKKTALSQNPEEEPDNELLRIYLLKKLELFMKRF